MGVEFGIEEKRVLLLIIVGDGDSIKGEGGWEKDEVSTFFFWEIDFLKIFKTSEDSLIKIFS
jgi:hypothetical protein